MDSWRIKVRNFDRSQVSAVAEKKKAAMVIKAPKGPNTPVYFAKGNTDYIRDVFGEPSAEYPQIWEALEYNQYGPIWLSSPYVALTDRLPGVKVTWANTTGTVTPFATETGPTPASVASGAFADTFNGVGDIFAVFAKSPYAGLDLAVKVTAFLNPLKLTEHLFSLTVYKKNSLSEWIEIEKFSELSFDPESKNAAGLRIYMPLRVEASKYVQVVMNPDVVVSASAYNKVGDTSWPATMTFEDSAFAVAGGLRSDIDALGAGTAGVPINVATPSTYTWAKLSGGEETALANTSSPSIAAANYYKVLPLVIDDTDPATFVATRLLTTEARAAAVAAGTMYKVTPAAPVADTLAVSANFHHHLMDLEEAQALTLNDLYGVNGKKYFRVVKSGVPEIDFATTGTFTPTRIKTLNDAITAANDGALYKITPVTPVDLTDDATFFWAPDTGSITLDTLQFGETTGETYYAVTEVPMVQANLATYRTPEKLTTVAEVIAAAGHVYLFTQTTPASGSTYDRTAKVNLINACWDEYKKKTLYPADLFMDDSGFIEVATKFKDLRAGFQKYSFYLHKIAHLASEDFSALQARMATYAASIDTWGMAYFVNDGYIRDSYTGKEYWSSMIGRIGIKYAAMEDTFDGLAPAGIDENNHGGLLNYVSNGAAILKLRHYYTDEEDELLDTACVNPILWDVGYGAYIGGQKTAQNPKKWTDYSYVNFARATDYIRKNIVEKSLVKQLWKLMDPNHRFMVISGCEAIIKPVLAAGILDDAIAFVTATDETNSQRKFVLNVAVRTTPTAEYIEFNFTNVGQGVDVKSVQS